MALSREEVNEIAGEIAKRVVAKAGLNCSCKDIEPAFLQMIEQGVDRVLPESRGELIDKLKNVAKACGYERDSQGYWTQFPKQDAVLGEIGPYTIVQEHDDGDLTIDSKNWGPAVVTTDGQVFIKSTMPIEVHKAAATENPAAPYINEYKSAGDKVVNKYNIAGSNLIVYNAWEPSGIFGPHSTITMIEGKWYGRIGTRRLSPDIEKLQAGSKERIEAVGKAFESQYEEAYKLIEGLYPESANGRHTMGEIEKYWPYD